MPFTGSHAAAVLPLRRTSFAFSALVIGSFGPDFEYFLFVSPYYRDWHHFPNVIFRCFPACLLFFYLFHLIVKDPFVGLLPKGMQRRLSPTKISVWTSSVRCHLNVCASLLIGIETHLVWDSFTHDNTWPTSHWRWLSTEVAEPIIGSGPRFVLLQDLSSLIGLAVLGIALIWWYVHTEPRFPVSRYVMKTRPMIICWFLGLSICLSAGIIFALWAIGTPRDIGGQMRFAQLAVVAAIAIFLWEILLYGATRLLMTAKRIPV